MCGIVGYVGNNEAYPIIIKGLKRLEYRGYDSAGISIGKKNSLNIIKQSGKVSDLELSISKKKIEGTIGMGHTRWASHGKPSKNNAHPHFNQDKNILHTIISKITIDDKVFEELI